MRAISWIIGAAVLSAAAIGSVAFRPDRALLVASGLAAHSACSAAFVSRVPGGSQTNETLLALVGWPSRFIRVQRDPKRATTTANFLGLARQTARFTPGYGCRLENPANRPLGLARPPAPEIPIVPTVRLDPALNRAIKAVFDERPGAPPKAVKAMVVLRDGRIVAERYAAGIGPATPLPSWSVAKSLTNLMLGVLVRDGRLRIDQRVAAPEWGAPGDPRAAITVEQLLRMTSGLDATEDESPSDPVARMEFLEPDMAAFAASRPSKARPGAEWEYTSANTLILDRLIGQVIGGGPTGVRAFVQREIAAPLGLTSLTMEFDGAGTFIGSTFAYLSARDYAQLGQLYLNDGVANGRRLLPAGWVAWSRRSTLGAAYGAGFWTNDGGSPFARHRIAVGFPADGFFASGTLGQRIYIVPSARLVIVRLGNSVPPDFGIDDDLALIATAVRSAGAPAPSPAADGP